MRELIEQGIEIDGQRYDLVLATGARKHGDFLFAHTPYWKKIAPTFEKIMAYGGIMLTSCREPPRQFKHLRVLIVEEDGEYGTGDCNAKMADWLFEEFGQQGHRFRAGQFRLLAEREDESGMVVVGKGTIKRMEHQDVDERGQPYDLILPESSLKGNSPGPGEYVWDTTHLGFNAWSERRRVKFSYQYLRMSSWMSERIAISILQTSSYTPRLLLLYALAERV
jgi:hypothetical protein